MTENETILDTALKRVDQLYEFEREPVAENKLESGRHFAAVYAGEHVAGTEFIIGAVFVAWGVGAHDLFLGILFGNLLAVLSWTLICAPIAVQTRLTLYWYLRRIAGPAVTWVYNVLNAVLFCILSGTMITVSASAVRIPFGIPPQTNWYPEDPRFVLVVLGVGAVVVTVAILGFRRLAQFSTICVPWIFAMFIAGAVSMLPVLASENPEVTSIGSVKDLWLLAEQQVWLSNPDSEFGFWHVAAFTWICNLAFHVGLSDMAILRFAPKLTYGLFSAFGMYLGHFLAWICAGVMGAAAALLLKTSLAKLDPGEVAWQSLGTSGILCVILAGWATSNPTLYRAGLALQAVTPSWPRWLVTLIAGIFTTVVACFPFVFGYLLEFVALFGILLVPIGAIVFVEHWIFPRLGLCQFRAARLNSSVNIAALFTWILAITVALGLFLSDALHMFFLALPIWLLAAVVYTVLSKLATNPETEKGLLDTWEMDDVPRATLSDSAETNLKPTPSYRAPLLLLVGIVALVSLAICLFLPFWFVSKGSEGFEQRIGMYKNLLAVASIVHLASAGTWVLWNERKPLRTQ